MALREREYFSPNLKKWHPNAVGIAVVVLHNCYGKLLKQFLCGATKLTNESIDVLQRAGKLENFLVQMVIEDSTECEDGGKAVVREMVPYDVDSVILKLLKQWIDDKIKKGKDCLRRARETEVSSRNFSTEKRSCTTLALETWHGTQIFGYDKYLGVRFAAGSMGAYNLVVLSIC